MLSLIWWAVVLGAAYQAMRAWGPPAAIGVVLACLFTSWLLPWIGGLVTAVAAVAIGARAEGRIEARG